MEKQTFSLVASVVVIALLGSGVLLGCYGTMLTLGLVTAAALVFSWGAGSLKESSGGDSLMLGPLNEILTIVALAFSIVAFIAWVVVGFRFLLVTAHPLTWSMFFR